ncbi:MAG: Fe-Mn family superoxide dismutase [Candidatus Berkelbacteria bacterium]|nr:Fe-Mn family superoxide dismutase [Candidatus Berkelbacteria bacterium]MCR4307764.1 Fe-Mn family superoxide dismutase [Candidatus Berkelbacteria bacterium]
MYEARKFRSIKELDGISEKTMTEHYKLYEGYVKKYNEITEKLSSVDLDSANQTYSDIRALKVDLTFAIGGIKNHELYFNHLGGDGVPLPGKMLEQITKDFGSFEAWQKDMKATAMAARGWAWLAYDRDFKKLFNYIGDAQNSFPVWNATPLLALDVYEHAYFIDFATKRADYIETFFQNLDWEWLEKHFVDHVLE